MARDIRADLGLPDLPFMLSEYETGASGEFDPTLPWPALVLEQSRLVATKLTGSAVISSQGIAMQDDHHYSWPAGQTEFATRCVAAIKSKNWFPPTRPTGVVRATLFRAPVDPVRLRFLAG